MKFYGSGSYSTVLRCRCSSINRACVLKIIKFISKPRTPGWIDTFIKRKQLITEEVYSNVFQETVICKALSNLHSITVNRRGHEFKVHAFAKVFKMSMVTGPILDWDNNDGDGKRTGFFECTRLTSLVRIYAEYIVICMEKCGVSLRKAVKQNGMCLTQIVSVLQQLVFSLIAAEVMYEYEHRDLHEANIMVRTTSREHLSFVIHSRVYTIPTNGVRLFIIDNTFARARIGEQVYYTYLSNKLETIARKSMKMADSEMHPQEVVYKNMYFKAAHHWDKWMPESNVWWVCHIVNRIFSWKSVVDQTKMVGNEREMDFVHGLRTKLAECTRLEEMLTTLNEYNDRNSIGHHLLPPPRADTESDQSNSLESMF